MLPLEPKLLEDAKGRATVAEPWLKEEHGGQRQEEQQRQSVEDRLANAKGWYGGEDQDLECSAGSHAVMCAAAPARCTDLVAWS